MASVIPAQWLETAGLALLLLVLAQATLYLYTTVRRRAEERTWAERRARVFQRQAEQVLARADRDWQREQSTWNGWRKFIVERIVEEADGIRSFYLRAHDGKAIPTFEPGQYLTFQLRIPGQERPLVRCYSLSAGIGLEGAYRVTIKHIRGIKGAADGVASTYFHTVVKQGDILDVKAPAGHFFLQSQHQRPVVLIGGGIGVTPVLSMLESLCAANSERETWFFYGVRNRREQIMADHLGALARDHDNIHLVVCHSDPDPDSREGQHYQVKGRVSVDLFRRLLPSNNYQFYICGPTPLMNDLTRQLAEWGVPESDVLFEAFGPASVKTAAQGAESACEVVFARSGRACQWSPESGSLLDLAEANGIVLEAGCRAGNCGTCVTAVKEGEVHYAVPPGATPETGACLICVAYPRGRLVIDA